MLPGAETGADEACSACLAAASAEAMLWTVAASGCSMIEGTAMPYDSCAPSC